MTSTTVALILSCKGGGAHQSAVACLEPQLKGLGFTVVVEYPIEGMLPCGINASSIYNDLLQKGWLGTASCLVETGSAYGQKLAALWLDTWLETLLTQLKPKLIISVIPFINNFLLRKAHANNIPSGIVTVDIGMKLWVQQETPLPPNFRIFIAHDISEQRTRLEEQGIPPTAITVSGFPLRKAFCNPSPSSQLDIKKQLNLPVDKKTVLVMGGGAGSSALVDYVTALAPIPDICIVVICGRSQELLQEIESKHFPSVIALGFITNIEQYMRAADLLVTKPGPLSLEEARMCRLPVLMARTPPPLAWEIPNIEFVLSRGYGQVFSSVDELRQRAEAMLQSDEGRKKLDEDNPTYVFDERFREWVESITKNCVSQQPKPTQLPRL